MKRNFVNLCNNPEKLFPTAHLDIKEYKYDIYWQKERATNIFQVKKRPAKVIETIKQLID